MVPSQSAQLTTLDPEIGAQACTDTALYYPPCPARDPSAPLVRPHLKLTNGSVELRLWFLIGCSRSIQKETRREVGVNIYTLLLLLLSHFSRVQLCATPSDPIDGRPPGSAVPGILQARTLEWVVISFSSARK